jgi:hypothetical protein
VNLLEMANSWVFVGLRLNFGEWPVPDGSQKKQHASIWRIICCVDVCRECPRDMFL